jgi:predicted nucleic acid-binding protein
VATLFLDSNTVVKYYVVEPGTSWVRRIINSDSNTCVICAIMIVEVASALAQLRRSGRFGQQRMRRTFTNFRADIRNGPFFTHPVDAATLEFAAELALRHSLKGFDATQVASAILAQDILDMPVSFVSGDKQALSAAHSEGLATDDPFEHIDDKPQG